MIREPSNEDLQLQKLFEAAHQDRSLKLKLLADPRKVAGEWGVQLEEQEVERLTKLGSFVQLANEARYGTLHRYCDPRVCYPSTVWLYFEVKSLVGDLISEIPGRIDLGPIFYPPPIMRFRTEDRLRHNLGLRQELSQPKT